MVGGLAGEDDGEKGFAGKLISCIYVLFFKAKWEKSKKKV
ncbi:hypothetical protein Ccrd_010932 [Cynara cardunculus var. scolymus]|uniref:Uncharacterized protein n=1 Tax=Cynara cardunculus var. scolymus TaxID=59895 RepID=A0A103YKE2_CYNCS|nr:hypothetical protein Ccrd_010932 [Cynara cardunculus var. scolymus]